MRLRPFVQVVLAFPLLGCADGSSGESGSPDTSADTTLTDLGADLGADAIDATDASDGALPAPDPTCVVPDVAGPPIAITPPAPTDIDALTMRVSDSTAYTNVAMRLCTPLGARDATFVAVAGSGPFEWTWNSPALPTGITQVIFFADPAKKVYSTTRVTIPLSSGDAAIPDALVGPTPTLCAAPPKNLIAHGTFEEGMTGLAPTGWVVRNPARPGECSGKPSDHVYLTDASTTCGGKALTVDSSGGAWDCYAVQIVSDYKTIVAGRSYRISATVRSKGNAVNPAAWFTVGAQWVDKGDAFFGDVKNPKTTEIDYDWKVLSYDVVAPSGAERILIWLSGHYPARVDYDNVSVVELP
jgi:hypothetical protein